MKESKHSSRLKCTRTFMLVICGLIALLCSSVQCFSQSTMLTYVAPPSVRRYVATQSRLASPLVRVSLWSNEDNEPSVEDYFIRRAVLADTGTASKILADGFFGDRDYFTYQIEKFRTYMSLESDFPTEQDEHVMLVACQSTNGKVVAVCNVDNRPALKLERPYMCNLAVDKQWRGKGLAKALVVECEKIVTEDWGENKLLLKARQRNTAALELYKSLGYTVESEGYDTSYMDHLVVMKKSIGKKDSAEGSPATNDADVSSSTTNYTSVNLVVDLES